MKVLSLLTLLAAVGCADDNAGDVVGPYTGEVHRFVIDRFSLPLSSIEAHTMGDDLDGDRTIENQFGNVVATLYGQGDVTTHAADMIASGVLASTVELSSDGPVDDETVGVALYGAEGDPAESVGGVLRGRVFTSNRTATTSHAGRARLHLPLLVDTDPVVIDLVGMELDLQPDGHGGFDGTVRGGFLADDVLPAAYDTILAMLAARPQSHHGFWALLDRDRDGTISYPEFSGTNSLMTSLLRPDINLKVDGKLRAAVSVGFGIHLTPCPAGQCLPATIPDACFDRVRDRDETDVDCGGSCQPCGGTGTLTCVAGEDCQTGRCEAALNGNVCAAPSCSDGRLDGYETAVDCGGSCTGCPVGAACLLASDCAGGNCQNGHCT